MGVGGNEGNDFPINDFKEGEVVAYYMKFLRRVYSPISKVPYVVTHKFDSFFFLKNDFVKVLFI